MADPKYQNVWCSQCGGCFGPGDQGFSHCTDHPTETFRPSPDQEAPGSMRLIIEALEQSTPNAAYYPEPRERHAAALKAARVALDLQKDAERYQWLRARPALIRKLVLELGYGYGHTPGGPMSGSVYLDETLDEVIASGVDAWGREVESVAAMKGDQP